MTESEWLICSEPELMLAFVEGRASERKLRLFAAACCDEVRALLPDENARELAGLLARWVEESPRLMVSISAWLTLGRMIRSLAQAAGGVGDVGSGPRLSSFSQGVFVARIALLAARSMTPTGPQRGYFCDLAREVFGNPFGPPRVEEAWLRWDNACVANLARSMRDGRRFDDLPVLADALEDAGCDETGLLEHLRRGSEHVPGCWALDALLGES